MFASIATQIFTPKASQSINYYDGLDSVLFILQNEFETWHKNWEKQVG
jgi:hypothetical protein